MAIDRAATEPRRCLTSRPRRLPVSGAGGTERPTFILERQRTHQTWAVPAFEQNYGPDGIALWAAGLLFGLCGGMVGCVGLVLLYLSGDGGPLLQVGYGLLVAAAVLECPAMIRAVRGIRAGRQFRGTRPFVKGPG